AGGGSPVPVPGLGVRPGGPAGGGAAQARRAGVRPGGVPAGGGGGRRVGGFPIRQPREGARAARASAHAAPRPLRVLAAAGAPLGTADRVRRARELEADLPELLRVLPLPPRAPGAREAFALPERRQ